VLARCSRDGVPVTIAGGRTGLVGGSVPPEDGSAIVVSTERLTALSVDAEEGTATAGAGVSIADLQARARAAGWEYAVDFPSRDSATVGGSIATDAGGVHVVAYGATGAQVLEVTVVRMDGTVEVGADAREVVGSEGIFGVIAEATVRLHRAASSFAAAVIPVDDVAQALRVLDVARTLPHLRAVEYCEAPVVDRTHVLVEIAGPIEALAPLEPETAADDAAGLHRLWAPREGAAERVARESAERGAPVHKLDVAVPLGSLVAFRAALMDAVPATELRLWGHLAEGHLHVNVWGSYDDAVLDLVVAHGGDVSSEHGVGRAKVAAFAANHADRVAALRERKDARDPQWLLNPGVLITREG